MGFQLTVFKNKRTFMKKAVLHTTTLQHTTSIHCRARHDLRDLFGTNQGTDTEMWQDFKKKPQIFEKLVITEDINCILMEDLNL